MSKKRKKSTKPQQPGSESAPPHTASAAAPAAAATTASRASASANPPPKTINMGRIFSFIVLLLIIAVIGALSYRVMQSFLLPLFLAVLLVIMFHPIYAWLLRRLGNHKPLAAGLTTALILLIVLAPLAWATALGIKEGREIAAEGPWADTVAKFREIPKKMGLTIPYEEPLNDLRAHVDALRLDEDVTNNRPEFNAKRETLNEVTQDLNQVLDQAGLSTWVATVAQECREQAVSPTTVCQGLKGAEYDELDQRTRSALPEFARLRLAVDSIQTLLQESKAGSTTPATPISQYQIDKYRQGVDRAIASYRTSRIALLGGVMRAPVTELLNPTQSTIESFRLSAARKFQGWLLKVTGQTPSVVGGLLLQSFILILSVYYFLIDGPSMIKSAMRLSPLDDQYEAELLAEFDSVSRAVVLATLLSALAQAILALIGYFFAGIDSLFVLFVLTAVLAMIPFVGAAAVWVPVCLFLAFVENRIPAAIGLAAYGTLVISMADNVIKPWVLNDQSNLHPLPALLSVLGGVQALGPVGILVGPMVVSFMQALLNILQRDLERMDHKADTERMTRQT